MRAIESMNPAPVGLTRACDNLAGLRIQHIADGVHRHNRADYNSGFAYANARASQPRLHRLLGPEHFADGRARARAYVALRHSLGRCCLTGFVTRVSRRPDFWVTNLQIVKNRGRHNRHYDVSNGIA